MSNIEHLIENALIAMTETKEDKYQAFVNEMSRMYNQQMLKEVSITEKELWEIAQYIVYTWIPNMDAEPVKHGRWRLGRGGKGTCDQCHFTQLNVWDYDNWQRYCGCCGAKMGLEVENETD